MPSRIDVVGAMQVLFQNREQIVPSRTEGPREMFSWGARTFLGGILTGLLLAVENEEPNKNYHQETSHKDFWWLAPVLPPWTRPKQEAVGRGKNFLVRPLVKSPTLTTAEGKKNIMGATGPSLVAAAQRPHSKLRNSVGSPGQTRREERKKRTTTAHGSFFFVQSLLTITSRQINENGCLVCVFPQQFPAIMNG